MRVDRFWVTWWSGLVSFVAGIILVGAIPGDQGTLGNLLAPSWLIILAFGVATSQRHLWSSPMTYWALAFALTCTIGRLAPTDLTAGSSLAVLFIGLPVAGVLWWSMPSLRERQKTATPTHSPAPNVKSSRPRGKEEPQKDQIGPRPGMTLLTAITLVTACIAVAAVASMIAWTSGEQAQRQMRLANTNPESYGPACDAYMGTVTTFEDALFENFSFECQMEIEASSAQTASLRREAEGMSSRATVAWVVAGVAGLATLLILLVYHRQSPKQNYASRN